MVYVGNELGDPFLSSFVTGDFIQLSLVFVPNTGGGPGIGSGWETPFGSCFPIGTMNPGLKASFSPGSGNRD